MKKFVSFSVLALSLCYSAASILPPKYRSDYEYNRWTESFYKLHTEAKTSWEATKICQAEGAEVLSVDGLGDMKQIHDLFKMHSSLGDHLWVRSGDHRPRENHINEEPQEDEKTLAEPCKCFPRYKSVGRHGDVENLICSKELPFICKVHVHTAPYDNECDVFSQEYINNNNGSCYHISSNALTWHEAEAECRAQNAHLVIVNSETERLLLEELIRVSFPVDGVYDQDLKLHAGYKTADFRQKLTAEFQTIFGETLKEAGFAVWGAGEPNNEGGSEYCGSITRAAKLNDEACQKEKPYICEKALPLWAKHCDD